MNPTAVKSAGFTPSSLGTFILSATCSGGLWDEACSPRSCETTQPWLHMPWIRIQMVMISHYYQGQISTGDAEGVQIVLQVPSASREILRQVIWIFLPWGDHVSASTQAMRTASVTGRTWLRTGVQEWSKIWFWFCSSRSRGQWFLASFSLSVLSQMFS